MANRTTQDRGGRDYSRSSAGRNYSRDDDTLTPGTDYSRPPEERRKAERRPAERRERAVRERPVRERRVAGRSAGLALVGFGTLLAGAWGGIAPYIGPAFGYKFSNLGSFQWTEANALLRLAPGAVAVLAGLAMLVGGARLGGTRAGPWFWGLMAVLCGAWFVVGPAVWELLGNANPVIQGVPSSAATFVNRVGAQLGVGLLLAFFGANAMGLVSRMTRIVRD